MKINSGVTFKPLDFVSLFSIDDQGSESVIWKKTGIQYIPVSIFNTSIRVYYNNENVSPPGFKMLYSYHDYEAVPVNKSGLFDCSDRAAYAGLRPHVHCNLERECVGGEDEGAHCPFSSAACKGGVAAGGTCYSYTCGGEHVTWTGARRACRARGMDLAAFRSGQNLCTSSHLVQLFCGSQTLG